MYRDMLADVKSILGSTEMFHDAKAFLGDKDDKATKTGYFSFRKRSEHTMRVCHWIYRLINENQLWDIDKKSLYIAAIFHDVGYGISLDPAAHPAHSERVFEGYAWEHKLCANVDFIKYLIANHSEKHMIKESETPIELVILMEADLLDESGALAIVWDCMAEGMGENPEFIKAFEHIWRFTCKILRTEPMATHAACAIWKEKQDFVKDFISHLAFDLAIDSEDWENQSTPQ